MELKDKKSLGNKIDFAVIFNVKNANPNGDPLNGNRPRETYDGFGEVSDVCIKRKIRNRLMEAGEKIFVQSDNDKLDEHRSLRERAGGILGDEILKSGNDNELIKKACGEWIDVRAFGQLFAYKKVGNIKSKGKGKKGAKEEEHDTDTNTNGNESENKDSVSVGIRGPVSIQSAFSVVPIGNRISSIQITKSVNGETGKDNGKKASDTMGMKHRVDHGLYVFYGAINPQLASKTGFSDEDAETIKKAIEHLFDNDASTARPEGSMEIVSVIWWKHKDRNGQYSSARVHRSLTVDVKDGVEDPDQVEDYTIRLKSIPELSPDIYNPYGAEIAIE